MIPMWVYLFLKDWFRVSFAAILSSTMVFLFMVSGWGCRWGRGNGPMNYVVVQHAELAQQVLNFIRYKFPSFLDNVTLYQHLHVHSECVTPVNHGAYLHGHTVLHAQHPHQTVHITLLLILSLYTQQKEWVNCSDIATQPSVSRPGHRLPHLQHAQLYLPPFHHLHCQCWC